MESSILPENQVNHNRLAEAVPLDEERSLGPVSGIKFEVVCRFLEGLRTLRGKEKTKYAQQYFFKVFFPNQASREDAYPLLRLLMPSIDRERGNYFLKEVSLGRVLAQAAGLNKESALRLKHFKDPAYHPKNTQTVGDFIKIMRETIGPFCRRTPTMTVADANMWLDKLAASAVTDLSVNPKLGKRVLECSELLRLATDRELEWICRMILRDLNVGMRYERVLTLFHPKGLERFNYCYDLKQVCSECARVGDLAPNSNNPGNRGRSEIEGTVAADDPDNPFQTSLNLFHPVRPQLAARKTWDEIRGLFEGEQFYVENKYDGERIQAHFNEQEIRFYSRNCHDVTSLYLPQMETSLRQALTGADAGILDGELIVVESGTLKAVEFGKNKTVALSVKRNQEPDQLFHGSQGFSQHMRSSGQSDDPPNTLQLFCRTGFSPRHDLRCVVHPWQERRGM